MTVVQPGTIEAFETSPLYSRIAGYVQKYRVNIGDRVKAGDVLLDMWIPDFDEQLAQKSAAVKRADVQISRDRERPACRRRQARDGQGPDHLGRGRREEGPGQFHPLGVGVQATGAACRQSRPRRAGARRDVSPVRGGRGGPRSGQGHGFRDELRARPGNGRPRPGRVSTSRRPEPTWRSRGPTSARPMSSSSTGGSRLHSMA